MKPQTNYCSAVLLTYQNKHSWLQTSSVTRALRMVYFGCYLVYVACLSWKLTVDWLESFAVLLKIACVLSVSSFESEKQCL